MKGCGKFSPASQFLSHNMILLSPGADEWGVSDFHNIIK